jgi:ribonuclease BN (tRNA processing enzyme)
MAESGNRRETVMRKVLCTALTILLIIPFSRAQASGQCEDKSLTLQVLGSGGPEIYKRRASTSYILWIEGRARALIDAGAGSLTRFGRAGAEFPDLQVILLTHFHVDHSVDLAAYIKAGFFTQRNTDLPVLGPTGNALMPSMSEYLRGLIGKDSHVYRYLSDFLPPGDAAFEYRPRDIDVSVHKVLSIGRYGDMQVSATPVHHGPIPALAWRIDVADKSVAISGDMNGDYNTLAPLAKGANLLIAHHAIPQGATGVARNLHMPPSVIGEIAKQAGVKNLVLTHRMHRTFGHEQQSLKIIQRHYDGPVHFADDLDCYPL